MAGSSSAILREVRKLIKHPSGDSPSDRELLERFSRYQDEAAFGELVRRHGTLVLEVCRRVLRHVQDAEDAFQATFLLLAQKAGSLGKVVSVAGWLFGVARHVAARAKTGAQRRRRHEISAALKAAQETQEEVTWKELKAALDEELGRLPEHYRTPLLLCYLEGKTQEEAARELGWTPAAMRGRFYRGRDLLRRRLTHRGISLGVGVFASVLSQSSTSAATTLLRRATVKAVLQYTAGKRGTISAEVVALAQEALPMIAVAKARLAIGVFLALTMVATGAALLAHQPVLSMDDKAQPNQSKTATNQIQEEKKEPRLDRFGDPLPPGAVARLGTVRFRHELGVYSVAYSPDGQLLASGGPDGTIRIWEARTGRELRRCVGHADTYALLFSPNGKWLASRTLSSPNGEEKIVRIWDVDSGKELHQLKGDGYVFSTAFSPDSKVLASAGSGTMVRLWDPATGEVLRTLEGHKGGITAVAFSHDGKHLASASSGTVRLWDLATGKEVGRFDQKDRVHVLLFSLDDKNLIPAGEDETIHWWEVATGQELKQFKRHKGYICKVALSRDGKTLVSGGYQDRSICIWDVGTVQEVRRIGIDRAELYGIYDFAVSPNGKTVAVATLQNLVRIWDVGTGKEVLPGDGPELEVAAAGLSADGKTAVSLARDGTMRQWDAATGEELRRSDWGYFGYSFLAAFSPEANVAAVGQWKGAVRLVDISAGKPLPSFEALHSSKTDSLCNPVFSPNGRMLATGSYQEVRIWDVSTGKELRKLKGIVSRPFCLSFSADGTLLAVADVAEDDAIHQALLIRLYDVTSGKELRQIRDTSGYAAALAFTPDGRTLIAWHIQYDKSVLIFWETASGKERARLVEEGTSRGSFAISPDGRTLASCGPDNTVRLWDVATARERHQLQGHRGLVTSLSFSADGKRLLSGSQDTSVLIWDLSRVPRMKPQDSAGLSVKDLDSLWADLAGDDAVQAYRAEARLTAAPRDTVAFLTDHLRAGPEEDAKRVAGLLADLDADDFGVREKAVAELEKMGEPAERALRKALEERPSIEVKRRIEQLLETLRLPPERLQALRALEVLEHLDTPESRQLLAKLADGAPDAWLTREAKAVNRRLAAKQR
jgi:RNA polymerase sigma factor (sigma-70 family)